MGNTVCSCTESQRKQQEHEGHLEFLKDGASFQKRKFTFGIGSGYELIRLTLNEAGDSLEWNVEKNTARTKSGQLRLVDIQTLAPKGKCGFCVIGHDKKDVLLEVEANEAALRDEWLMTLQLVLEVETGNKSAQGQDRQGRAAQLKDMVAEKAKQQKYWHQREADLTTRELAAEERKKKYAGAGMKYTAVAMSNRSCAEETF